MTDDDAAHDAQSVKTREPDPRRLTGPGATAVGAGLLGALIVTVIGLAAGSGSPVATSPRAEVHVSRAVPTLLPHEGTAVPRAQSVGYHPLLDLILRVFAVAVVVAILLSFVFILIWMVKGRYSGLISRRVLEPDELELMLTSPSEGVAALRYTPVEEALVQSRAALLDGTDVRAAVIAAWLRLEEVAVEAGTAHRDTDAPADLVGRVLAEQRVAPQALEQLAALYRRARYSPDVMVEVERSAALTALDAIRRDLTAGRADLRDARQAVAPRRGSADSGRWR